MIEILTALAFALLGLVFLFTGRLNRRVDRFAQAAQPPPAAPVLNPAAILQSREFNEIVRGHLFSVLEAVNAPATARDGAPNPAPPADPASKIPAPLTERETGLLDDLLKSASLRVEMAGTGQPCVIYIPEVNRQYQQDYTRECCENMARKLVAATRLETEPLLRKGGFIRVRNLREGVTSVDIEPAAIPLLRARFFQ